MLTTELHRKTVLQLYRSLQRGAQHLPLLLKPSQADLTRTFRSELKKRFSRELSQKHKFGRAHDAISRAIEWDDLVRAAFENPEAVAPLVQKLSKEHFDLTEQSRRNSIEKDIETAFEQTENNQNLIFPDFIASHRQEVVFPKSRAISAEEKQHRESQRLHSILLKRLKARIPRFQGRCQQLFTQCVLSANRIHQRELYKHALKLKLRERGTIIRDKRGSNIPQFVFHMPRHHLATQNWVFGKLVSTTFARHQKLMLLFKDLEKELSDWKEKNQFEGPRSPKQAERRAIKVRMTKTSHKITQLKQKLANEYPITMRRIKQMQKRLDRTYPEILSKMKQKEVALKKDTNLERLYQSRDTGKHLA